MDDVLSRDDKEFIADKAVRGFDEDEIVHLFQRERETPASADTIVDWLHSDDAEEEIDLKERIREKQAEVTREEIIQDMRDTKEMLQAKVEELSDSKHGKTFNEAVKNLHSYIESMAKMIGELEQASIEDSVIYVNNSENYIQENVYQVARHLPDDDKEELVKDLSDEVGLIVRDG